MRSCHCGSTRGSTHLTFDRSCVSWNAYVCSVSPGGVTTTFQNCWDRDFDGPSFTVEAVEDTVIVSEHRTANTHVLLLYLGANEHLELTRARPPIADHGAMPPSNRSLRTPTTLATERRCGAH